MLFAASSEEFRILLLRGEAFADQLPSMQRTVAIPDAFNRIGRSIQSSMALHGGVDGRDHAYRMTVESRE